MRSNDIPRRHAVSGAAPLVRLAARDSVGDDRARANDPGKEGGAVPDDQRWSSAVLEPFRALGDPLADDAIRAVAAAGRLDAVNQVMTGLVDNDDLPAADLPPELDAYIERSRELPEWVDRERLRNGRRLFVRYGPEMVQMLFGASLPILYAAHPGCEVLVATGRMTRSIQRRVIETGQFVIDVTEPDAFEPGGRGIVTTQKVRLMHAAIRHYLDRDDRWRAEWQPEWQTPICQEDLAGTMLSFSVTVCASLERSNITLTVDEKEDYLHLWKVIGHLLGIDDRLMPVDYPDAEALLAAWMARNHRPNDSSRELMQAMLDFWYARVPGRVFDGVTSGWCRTWIGDELADQLGVPPFGWTRSILRLQTTIWKYEDRFEDRVLPYQAFTRFWTRRLIKGLMHVERGGRRPDFHVPAQLQAEWGIKPDPDARPDPGARSD
jgi:hypothetical protein